MCGRFSLTPDLDKLQLRFGFKAADLSYTPRYNVAPTQEVLTVTGDGEEDVAQFMKWGLIPFWAKDPSIGNRMINARAETVVEKPSFRQAFQKRRCLIVADGFYEWRKEGKNKIPMRIILKSGEPLRICRTLGDLEITGWPAGQVLHHHHYYPQLGHRTHPQQDAGDTDQRRGGTVVGPQSLRPL